jgi:hypothetical protein
MMMGMVEGHHVVDGSGPRYTSLFSSSCRRQQALGAAVLRRTRQERKKQASKQDQQIENQHKRQG